jgi:hypothetical protein
MVRKEIKYTDYNGNEATFVAYFNLSRTECIDMDMEFEDEGGMMGHMKALLPLLKQEENAKKKPLVDFIKMMVAKSYGVRPKNDPSLFLKEDEDGHRLFYKFKASPAYDEFVFNLMNGKESLNDFIEQILPDVPDGDKNAAIKQLKKEGFDIGEEVNASTNNITKL